MKEQSNTQHLKTGDKTQTSSVPVILFNKTVSADVPSTHPIIVKEQHAKPDLSTIINYIVEAVQPEKIFCLSHQPEPDNFDFADLMIIIPEGHSLGFKQIEDVLQLLSLRNHRLNYTFFTGLYFDRMMKEGHVYYTKACNSDSLLYDNGYFDFPDTDRTKIVERIEKAEFKFNNGMKKAQTFLANADYRHFLDLPMAPFLLERSAEFCLRTLIKALSGRTKRLPNLKALLQHCRRFSPGLPLTLCDGGQEDERLLALLEMAGNSYRYADGFKICDHDLDLLFERVEKLHRYAAYTFNEWLAAYKIQFSEPSSSSEERIFILDAN